jgi:signal transduction histidine kinase
MKLSSLLWKLVFAFLLVAVTTAGLLAVFIRLTSADRLANLVVAQQRSNLETALVDYYNENGSFTGIADNWQQLRLRSFPNPQNDPNAVPSDRGLRDRRRLFGLADVQGVILVEVDPNYPAGSIAPSNLLASGTQVKVNGKAVGTILTANTNLNANFNPGFNPEENLFLQRTTEALTYAVIGSMLVALLIGIVLARTLIRPLRDLTEAAEKIAQGQLEQQVKIGSRDEIGRLGEAFNRMSQKVAHANLLRKQMTADIAHDLRTPLTVIAGYIESMRDGVLQPTPARLSLIYTEIEGLQNLVGDLRMLTQVDAGELPLHPQRIAPRGLLEHAAATYEHRADQQEVHLELDAPEDLPDLNVDEGRMMQVFGNLLSNALRYTPAGGGICLSARAEGEKIVLEVADTGEGIAEEDLPFIFDRFRRADRSRHSETGESGLGLAIVKALVEAHGGTVRAASKLEEGTTITIELPVYSPSSIRMGKNEEKSLVQG